MILNWGLSNQLTLTRKSTAIRSSGIDFGIHIPVKNAVRTLPASKHYKNISYETLAASWFTNDGWEVLMPLVDHGSKTDLVIVDDSNFYRIQVKSLASNDEE
ncbi:group I intron-associated PD-(D/E)XK endonuclease [Neptunomonas sp.]|uniref:group I intron-associated PD-(D/E)XK endonuclease n=1 Tax=Neptunomonas sp. TaxID=1971898 RepID=UPI0025FA2549|nr:group I intron-associated PD-(D/E)XK endonuclease [Neptunomonas sp.]